MLLVARGIMGAGAGIVIPMGQALLSIMFRGSELSRAMTAWAITGTLGVPFGPVVGGTVTAIFGWRGIFVARHRDHNRRRSGDLAQAPRLTVAASPHEPHDL